MTCINSSVVSGIILAILLLGGSVPALANPSNSYEKPSEETPKESKITCQSFGNLCPGQGTYKCCDGLECRPNAVGGVFVCLPPLVPGMGGEDDAKCRDIAKVCIDYGQYDCCGTLSCEPTLATSAFGFGVCLATGGPKASRKDKCQNQNHLCQDYGEYRCCGGLTCVDPRTLPNPPLLPVDPKMLPPGGGVCVYLPKI
ncbi:hypothetical protein vseg_000630 [Gypsophila vaccaria]